ncbi:hypothetical protein SDC9_194344 [bioreactor metagenome]|uniref:Uncharacterized protein n=1 Tax=bioreactor metagenome TaxID=1076179 RepID=A0A645I770_9ZZZZ
MQRGVPLRFDIFGPVHFLAEFSPKFIFHRPQAYILVIFGLVNVVAGVTAGQNTVAHFRQPAPAGPFSQGVG